MSLNHLTIHASNSFHRISFLGLHSSGPAHFQAHRPPNLWFHTLISDKEIAIYNYQISPSSLPSSNNSQFVPNITVLKLSPQYETWSTPSQIAPSHLATSAFYLDCRSPLQEHHLDANDDFFHTPDPWRLPHSKSKIRLLTSDGGHFLTVSWRAQASSKLMYVSLSSPDESIECNTSLSEQNGELLTTALWS